MKYGMLKAVSLILTLVLLLSGCAGGGDKVEETDSAGDHTESIGEQNESESSAESAEDTESDEVMTEPKEPESETEEEIKSIDLNGYTIVRGENEDEAVIDAIGEVYMAFLEKDIEVNFGVDIDTPKTEKEIRVGATDRSEDKNLRYSDYSIEYKDGSIYICGGSAAAIKKAGEWLLSKCSSEGVIDTDKLPREYTASYSMEDLKVFGIPMCDFSVEQSEGEADDELHKWLGSRTGMRKHSEKGYVIKVVADPALNYNEIGIELVGKELWLSASAHLGDLTVVTDYFLDAIKTRSSDDLEFNRREEIEMPEPQVQLNDVRDVSANVKMVCAETDKDPLSYKVGDEIVFICSLYADKTLVSCPQFYWFANTSDGEAYSGESDGSFGRAIIKIPATAEGGVHLKVLVKDENNSLISCVTQTASFSVVVNADDVGTKKSEPLDFDAFWADQLRKVEAVEPDLISMEKVNAPMDINVLDGAVANTSLYDFYRVKIKTPEECGYAVGYLTVPKNAKADSLGITVVFNGYGVGDLSPYVSSSCVVLNVCAHSYELGRESGYYKTLENGELHEYGFKNNDNRDSVYFRTMIMRDLQAVRFIKAYAGDEGVRINGSEKTSLGVWNGRLRLYGGSQGAFQGIAVASLDKDVTEAYWWIPWMCDVGGTTSEFRPAYTDALRYYDSTFFGKRIDSDVSITITAGLGDYICPPSGIVALFNQMGGSITMYMKQGMLHGYTPEIAPTTVYRKNGG